MRPSRRASVTDQNVGLLGFIGPYLVAPHIEKGKASFASALRWRGP
jgi:hypothetical protein